MRRVLLLAGAVALLGAGCASSEHEMREAQEHQYRADRAAAEGDYYKAAREQEKADRHRAEARDKSDIGY
jgi:hypothetical protein